MLTFIKIIELILEKSGSKSFVDECKNDTASLKCLTWLEPV